MARKNPIGGTFFRGGRKPPIFNHPSKNLLKFIHKFLNSHPANRVRRPLIANDKRISNKRGAGLKMLRNGK